MPTVSQIDIDFITGAPLDLEPLPDQTPDYEPTREDREWIAACNLDSFLPRGLVFSDWLAEVARQHSAQGAEAPTGSYGDWHAWLGAQIDRLAQVAVWCDAKTPADYDDRVEIYERELRDKCYDQGFKDGKRAAGVR